MQPESWSRLQGVAATPCRNRRGCRKKPRRADNRRYKGRQVKRGFFDRRSLRGKAPTAETLLEASLPLSSTSSLPQRTRLEGLMPPGGGSAGHNESGSRPTKSPRKGR